MSSALIIGMFSFLAPLLPQDPEPWPAEAIEDAVVLTPIDDGLRVDLSGAVWNPDSRALWVCRNSAATPSGTQLWKLIEDGAGGWQIAEDGGQPAVWGGIGDAEGITQAHFQEDTVYILDESEPSIGEWDVCVFGTALATNEWDISSYVPSLDGAEGITFVPDAHLLEAGFVDGSGTPYTSLNGMGGLMFVGSQEDGGIYVFDLDRGGSGSFAFVGQYETPYPIVRGLEFDRSTGSLHVWHGHSGSVVADYSSVLALSSEPTTGGRALLATAIFEAPAGYNFEGIAVVSTEDCGWGRKLFLTKDCDCDDSLYLFQNFEPGCVPIETIEIHPDNAHVYALLDASPWTIAEAQAINMGGHLATVRSEDENTWLASTFGSFGGVDRYLWIGLNDLGAENVWEWTNGESTAYRNWSPDEPNNGGGVQGDESFVHLYSPLVDPLFRWNDFIDEPDLSKGHHLRYGVVEISPTWTSIGRGLRGTLGVPSLTATVTPTVDLHITNSRGERTLCFLYFGTELIPTAQVAAETLAPPLRIAAEGTEFPGIILSLSAGETTVPFTVPESVALSGQPLYFQAVEQDPGVTRREVVFSGAGDPLFRAGLNAVTASLARHDQNRGSASASFAVSLAPGTRAQESLSSDSRHFLQTGLIHSLA